MPSSGDCGESDALWHWDRLVRAVERVDRKAGVALVAAAGCAEEISDETRLRRSRAVARDCCLILWDGCGGPWDKPPTPEMVSGQCRAVLGVIERLDQEAGMIPMRAAAEDGARRPFLRWLADRLVLRALAR